MKRLAILLILLIAVGAALYLSTPISRYINYRSKVSARGTVVYRVSCADGSVLNEVGIAPLVSNFTVRVIGWEGENSAQIEVKKQDITKLHHFVANTAHHLQLEEKELGRERFGDIVPGLVTIVPLADQDLSRIESIITAAGDEVIAHIGIQAHPYLRARISERTLNELANLVEVQWMENYQAPQLLNDVAAKIIGATTVWPDSKIETLGLTGRGQYITMVDSGIDTGKFTTLHGDLYNNVLAIQPVNSNCKASDTLGHGTHTAGSLVGDGTCSKGAIKGMAYEAKLWAWAGSDGGKTLSMPNYVDEMFQPTGLVKVVGKKVEAAIHSASWGNEIYRYNTNSQLIDKYCWEHPQMLPVFAAGNSSSEHTIQAEGHAKNALTVGASESVRSGKGNTADNENQVANFSSKGPTADNRIKPDIVAPGSFIVSALSSVATTPSSSERYALYDNKYVHKSGTSMATPIAAGAATLVRQWVIEKRQISNPTAALIKAIIMGGAVPLVNVPIEHQGSGRLNIAESLQPTDGRQIYLADNVSFSQGRQVNYEFTTTADAPLDVQLVWIDYPGTVSASTSTSVLVNNLDLVVTAQSETPAMIYLGNGGTTRDNRNNAESVHIDMAKKGKYRISVDGTNIRYGSDRGGAAALYVRGALDPNQVSSSKKQIEQIPVEVCYDDSGISGNCTPAQGTYHYNYGEVVTFKADSYFYSRNAFEQIHARHPLVGWTGTGDIPTQNTGRSISVVITQPSSITWHWQPSPSEYVCNLWIYLPIGSSVDNLTSGTFATSNSIWLKANELATLHFPDDERIRFPEEYTYKSRQYKYSFATLNTTGDNVFEYIVDANGTMNDTLSMVMTKGIDVILWYYPPTWKTNNTFPTWWYQKNLGYAAKKWGYDDSATGDPDNDGFTNKQEYQIDTEPLNFESRLYIEQINPRAITWRGGKAVGQVLEESTTLSAIKWKPLFTNHSSSANYIINQFDTNMFYRVSVPDTWLRQ